MQSNTPEANPVVIIGAGKIGRGFIAHQLFRGGIDFVLSDVDSEMVQGLRKHGQYLVRVVDAPEKSTVVNRFSVLDARQQESDLVRLIADTSLMFLSVGAVNLPKVAVTIGKALIQRHRGGNRPPLNIVVCENAVSPSLQLRTALEHGLGIEASIEILRGVGIADAVVLRTGMDPIDDEERVTPWDVDVQDYDDFPIDGASLVAPLPEIPGARVVQEFRGLLPRKLYTSNCANATLAYMGHLKGFSFLSDAAKDPFIGDVLSSLYTEIDDALAKEYGVPDDQKHDLSRISWGKLNNEALRDIVERNARDPLRKLGPTDRLVGAARIVMRHGSTPASIATGIAAALHYSNPDDPSAVTLQKMRSEIGIEGVLRDVSKIGDESLRDLILKRIEVLRARGYV